MIAISHSLNAAIEQPKVRNLGLSVRVCKEWKLKALADVLLCGLCVARS